MRCAPGHPPFRADSAVAVLRRVSDDQPRPVRQINPDMPEWLEAIISRLHSKDPARRFSSASELAEVLGRCLAHVQAPLAVALPPELVPPVRGITFGFAGRGQLCWVSPRSWEYPVLLADSFTGTSCVDPARPRCSVRRKGGETFAERSG